MLVTAVLFVALGAGVYGKNIGETRPLSNDVKELQNIVEEQEKRISFLERHEERIALLERRCEQSDNRVLRELQNQNETLTALMTGNDYASNEVAVAVQAYTEESVTGPSYLVFNRVELNIGDGYDAALGVFRAPVPGLYLVMVSITSTGLAECYAKLFHNGRQIRGANSASRSLVLGWNSASIQYILRLRQLDSLHVMVADGHACSSRPGDRYSSFAITLLGQ